MHGVTTLLGSSSLAKLGSKGNGMTFVQMSIAMTMMTAKVAVNVLKSTVWRCCILRR